MSYFRNSISSWIYHGDDDVGGGNDDAIERKHMSYGFDLCIFYNHILSNASNVRIINIEFLENTIFRMDFPRNMLAFCLYGIRIHWLWNFTYWNTLHFQHNITPNTLTQLAHKMHWESFQKIFSCYLCISLTLSWYVCSHILCSDKICT